MVIVNVIGGLGNQMFQYAAGRALALSSRQLLLLDTSDFAGYPLHQGFELKRVFHCETTIASSVEVVSLLGWRATPGIKRILARPSLHFLHGDRLVVEPHFHYWPGLRDFTGPAYLHGYWQSERYFDDAADVIRQDFAFKLPFSPINSALAARIGAANAVSLHVRRGDYVLDPKTNATHGLCSPEYYRAAVRYVADKTTSPEFFIFSDDIEWARTNVKMDYRCHYIDHNCGMESHNDMRLMSLCRHHIIANSSFSWWGAWLNPDPKKLVVAPSNWFANGKTNEDMLPASWTVL